MKITTKEKLKLLEETEELLNKLGSQVAYTGFADLVNAKTKICMLKTIFYAEEQLNENKTCK